MGKKRLLIMMIILLTGCTVKGTNNEVIHWTYDGVTGPEYWVMLSSDYVMCDMGKSQSPVNIVGEHAMGLQAIEFQYQAAADFVVINDGHMIQVNYPPGSYAVIGGQKFHLRHFQFHSPSEHKIHGRQADLAAHLVHQADDGRFAIVAMLFNKGADNQFLPLVWDAMPLSKGLNKVNKSIDINDLLPVNKAYFNYTGSLTAPPCSEGVNWNVLQEHGFVSAAQVAAFTELFPRNARPVQPLNGRMIGKFD